VYIQLLHMAHKKTNYLLVLSGRDPMDKTGCCAVQDHFDDLIRSLPVYLELPLINVGFRPGGVLSYKKTSGVRYYNRQPQSADTI